MILRILIIIISMVGLDHTSDRSQQSPQKKGETQLCLCLSHQQDHITPNTHTHTHHHHHLISHLIYLDLSVFRLFVLVVVLPVTRCWPWSGFQATSVMGARLGSLSSHHGFFCLRSHTMHEPFCAAVAMMCDTFTSRSCARARNQSKQKVKVLRVMGVGAGGGGGERAQGVQAKNMAQFAYRSAEVELTRPLQLLLGTCVYTCKSMPPQDCCERHPTHP